jgi:hypothetical protein
MSSRFTSGGLCLDDVFMPEGKMKAGLRRRKFACAVQSVAVSLAAVLTTVFFASCGSSGNPITIQLVPGGTVTTDQGQTTYFKAFLTNDISDQGVTWKFGTSCSGAACGVLSNTTAFSVTYTAPSGLNATQSVSLIATSVASSGVTATVTISVVEPPTFTLQTLPNGINGTPYNQTITVTGGVPPLTFALASGSLPAGLTLNTATGTILGRPTASTTTNSTFQIKVTDNGTIPLTVVSPYTYTIVINPAPPLSIATTSVAAATLGAPYSFRISAQGGIPPFLWTETGALPQSLQFDSSTGIISGTAFQQTGVQYPTSYPFSVSVSDSTLPTPQIQQANLSISVVSAQKLQINTLSLPQATVASSYSATVLASGGLPPYTWSLVSGQLPPGLTLSTQSDGSALISGTPTLQTNSTFTLEVTDSASVSVATNPALTLTVNPVSNGQALLSGTYSFLFSGFDADGSVTIIGALTSNGSGTISGGTNDSNRVSGIFVQSTYSGSYTIGTDGRGTLTLTSTNIKNQQLTTSYVMDINSDGSFYVVENDSTGTIGTGVLKLQQSSSFAASSFSGRYAFGFQGRDFNNAPAAMIGSLSADGVGTLSPGTMDLNDAGVFSSQLSLDGTFTVGSSSSLGRGAASFTYKLPSQQQITANYSVFFVSNSDIFFMATDTTDGFHPRFAGEMILQQPNQIFNFSALNGASVVSGVGVNFSGSNMGSSAMVGLLSPNGLGSASFSYDQNDSGTVTAPTTNSFPSGSYTVNTNGRVSFLNLGLRLASAYLTGQNAGFFLGSDLAVTTGVLENQLPVSSFTAASLEGNYALSALPPPDNQTNSFSGQASADGVSTVSGTLDIVPAVGPAALGQTLSGTYNPSLIGATTGRGLLTTNAANSVFPVNLAFYIVSPNSVRLLPLDSNNLHPDVIFFDH